ncbi:MAG: FliH/SctL family protein [Bacteroidota bacterium]|nr:FliH/SctL family protein [Candidatus Kapabacteria bacterium]MCS7302781.1 FliH/SctL family protein [Candidatus Kapabacteria bacterium]MCX7937758.1 FliH/SctL family protein [Chlorobiota bacterium]MDW8075460.1 FliH/SctL family protein [Bacteroidota bacterium]MDW8272317.1 FliH/SctL family protein [Bacteroidota bacterium]
MATRITIPLYRPPARIRILRDAALPQVEPLALEDFAEPLYTDAPEPKDATEHSTVELPAEEPHFTIEQVQQEVQAAYERGFAEGQEVASAVLETELRTLTERVRSLDAVILNLQQQYAEAIRQIEPTVLDLAITIARAILGYEAEQSIACVVAQARAALEQYHGNDAVTIRLHPEDLATLEKAGNPLAAHSSSSSITLVADSSVEQGGCIVETALGTFDAQLRTQLKRARELLSKQRCASSSDTIADEQ